MTGYTERPAFLQFFQILMTLIVLALVSYAYTVDIKWNNLVEKHDAVRICAFMLHSVDPAAYRTSVQGTLDSVQTYPVPKPDENSGHVLTDIKFFQNQIIRSSPQESTTLVLISLSFVMLIAHLIIACWSSDYEYRTKWAAAVQGMVIFFAGFSGIFLAISAHNFDENYQRLGDKFMECTLLEICRKDGLKNPDTFSKFLATNKLNSSLTRDGIKRRLVLNNACQHFQMKIGAGILCGVILIIGCIIICNAMELTTIYDEEDVDEEERARRDAFQVHSVRKKSSKTKALENQTIARMSIVSQNRRSMPELPKFSLTKSR